MKRIKSKKGVLAVIAAVFLALLIWAGTTPPVFVSAEAYENGNIVESAGSAPETNVTPVASGKEDDSFDWTIVYALVLGAGLFLTAVIVKFTAGRQPHMTKTVNLTAPNEMDPLLMGKLLDDTVNSEDLGALVFWFASEGYLHIDFTENEKDPTLYRSSKPIPDDMRSHCKIFYEGLFNGRESVRVSALNSSFYETTHAVKTAVKGEVGDMYSSKGGKLHNIYGFVSIILLGGFLLLYPLFVLPEIEIYWNLLFAVALAYLVPYYGSVYAVRGAFRWRLAVRILIVVGSTVAGIGFGALLCLFSSNAFGFWTKFIIIAFSAGTGSVCGFFLIRTEEYTEKLGHILGFKQFIEFAERDKIEFMLQENPNLYYSVLPYAQVLGVTDAWTEKFKGVNVKPPSFMNFLDDNFVFESFKYAAVYFKTFGQGGKDR